jgi:hypothetical protein
VRPGKTCARASTKDHVEISLKERSTSRTVDGNTGLSEPISEILFDFRMRRWRFGSFVRQSSEESDVSRLSSSVRSVIVGLGVCSVSAV